MSSPPNSSNQLNDNMSSSAKVESINTQQNKSSKEPDAATKDSVPTGTLPIVRDRGVEFPTNPSGYSSETDKNEMSSMLRKDQETLLTTSIPMEVDNSILIAPNSISSNIFVTTPAATTSVIATENASPNPSFTPSPVAHLFTTKDFRSDTWRYLTEKLSATSISGFSGSTTNNAPSLNTNQQQQMQPNVVPGSFLQLLPSFENPINSQLLSSSTSSKPILKLTGDAKSKQQKNSQVFAGPGPVMNTLHLTTSKDSHCIPSKKEQKDKKKKQEKESKNKKDKRCGGGEEENTLQGQVQLNESVKEDTKKSKKLGRPRKNKSSDETSFTESNTKATASSSKLPSASRPRTVSVHAEFLFPDPRKECKQYLKKQKKPSQYVKSEFTLEGKPMYKLMEGKARRPRGKKEPRANVPIKQETEENTLSPQAEFITSKPFPQATSTLTSTSDLPGPPPWKSQFNAMTRSLPKSQLKFSKANNDVSVSETNQDQTGNNSKAKFKSFTKQSLEARDKLATTSAPAKSKRVVKQLRKPSKAKSNIPTKQGVATNTLDEDNPKIQSPTFLNRIENSEQEPKLLSVGPITPPDLFSTQAKEFSAAKKVQRKAYSVSSSGKLQLLEELAPVPASTIPTIKSNKTSSSMSDPTPAVGRLTYCIKSEKNKSSGKEQSKRERKKNKNAKKAKLDVKNDDDDDQWEDEEPTGVAEVGAEKVKGKRSSKDSVGTSGQHSHFGSYNEEERNALYQHNRFIIRKQDISTKNSMPIRDLYYVFRIVFIPDGRILLQRYDPKEDEESTCGRIFHVASGKGLWVTTMDDGFYNTFLPIYYGVVVGDPAAPNTVHVMWRHKVLSTVKTAFDMNRYFGDFQNLMLILINQIIFMVQIERLLKEDDNHTGKKSWIKLTNMIEELSSKIFSHERWNPEAVEQLKIWPRITRSIKDVNKGQFCDVCKPSQRLAARRLIFSGDPYDHIFHLPLEGVAPEPKTAMQCCALCNDLILTAHQVYHLKHHLFLCLCGVYNKKIDNDRSLLERIAEVRDDILDFDDGHWLRGIFLDFSIVIGDGYKALQKMEKGTKREKRRGKS